MTGDKIRLDVALTERGLIRSREKAKSKIKNGLVSVNGSTQTKPGFPVTETDIIAVSDDTEEYVGRGALKLEKAVEVFNINLQDAVCIDVGASTGGFTEVMLRNGAKTVYAVDVGHGQLDKKLADDPRVINMEGTNFRYCTEKDFPDIIDFISVDVSFISLRLILPVIKTILKDEGTALCLVKPQFEAGKGIVGKSGVIKDINKHIEIVNDICCFSQECAFSISGLDYSPVKGSKGNIEYLLYLKKTDCINNSSSSIDIKRTVLDSHHRELSQL